MEAPNMSDEIIEELWKAKDDIAREHGNDVRKLGAWLQGRTPHNRRSLEDRKSKDEAGAGPNAAHPRHVTSR